MSAIRIAAAFSHAFLISVALAYCIDEARLTSGSTFTQGMGPP